MERTLFQLMTDSVIDWAMLMLDSQGRVVSWNAGAERIKGYAAEDILGRHFGVFYRPEDAAGGQPQLALDSAAREGRFTTQGWQIRKDGSCFWAHIVVTAIRDPAYGLLGFAQLTHDLTESKRAEEALQQTHDELERRIAEFTIRHDQALSASEERFRRVVEAAPNAMVLISGGGLIEMVNAQAERVFGYARAEMLGQPIEMLVPERYRPLLRPAFFGESAPRPMGAGRELHGLQKDGSEFPVEIGLNPIETDEGPMVLSAIVDITDRLQLEAQLRQAQKMEAVGRLTAGVAHDFNNLLQTMMGSLELLKDRTGDDQICNDLVAASIDAAQRGARLTHHLLAFSRKQMLRPSRIDIPALLRRTVDMLGRTLGPNIKLRAVEESPGLHAFADGPELEACLLNLAINARDAMPRGGDLTVRAYGGRIDAAQASETLPPGDYAVLAVDDTGAGMPPDILDKAFEPFFTTKNLGEGSGLGLPMVLGYARQSGGDVRIASVPGRGTRVEIFLPCTNAAAGTSDSDKQRRRPPRNAGRILLVDDAPDVLVTLGAFLEGAGFEVAKARSGDDALRIVASTQGLNAVVTDYAMPGMSGADLLLQVEQLRPGLPGLVVTGYPGIENLGELPAHIQVLRKPFLRAELLERVRALLTPNAPVS